DELGPICYNSNEEVFLGRDFAQSKNISDATAAMIDAEVKAIVDGAYERCTRMISDNMAMLDKIAAALMQYETIGEKQFAALFEQEDADLSQIHEDGLLGLETSAKAAAPAAEAQPEAPTSAPAEQEAE
ncbi:MAG: ATP-dependent metalloprotease, partial [Clostridia bacterium]|nr:ATP-dependent metalloprotease [Clostridia bacterium]